MRVTIENHGSIIDIGDISAGSLDTSGGFAGSGNQNTVGFALYHRRLDNQQIIDYKGSLELTPSQARAMASVLLSAATEAMK